MSRPDKIVDGRRLRSERSKKSILDACSQLMTEGVLVPTAQRVSDTAGVPLRSFFRHFPDMETLFSALDEVLRVEYERAFLEEIPEGSFGQRLRKAIDLHAKVYEANKSLFRSTKAQLWRYDTLQKNYSRNQRALRKDFDKRVPELLELCGDAREAVDAIASYEMWARMRDHQKLSISKSSDLIEKLILGLFEQP